MQGESKTPFVILLSYLNLVLFEQANASQLDTVSNEGGGVKYMHT